MRESEGKLRSQLGDLSDLHCTAGGWRGERHTLLELCTRRSPQRHERRGRASAGHTEVQHRAVGVACSRAATVHDVDT